MPSIAEILKASGLDDAAIAAIDAKAITALTGILTTADQIKADAERAKVDAATAATKAETDRKAAIAAQEAAELAQRSNKEFYDQTIAPALTGWEDKEKTLNQTITDAKAEVAFYRTQAEAAKESGFVPKEAPKFDPTKTDSARNDKGQYVAGAPGSTPGSPTFTMEQIDQRLGNGISNIGWAMQEYNRLTGGQFLPDSFDTLANEATLQRLPFRDYVAKKYDFQNKQRAINERVQKEHDDTVAKARDTEWETKLAAKEEEYKKQLTDLQRKAAENTGSNPDVKPAISSKMAEVNRAVKEGVRPDPLKMSDIQRQQETRKAIHDKILDNQGVPA